VAHHERPAGDPGHGGARYVFTGFAELVVAMFSSALGQPTRHRRRHQNHARLREAARAAAL